MYFSALDIIHILSIFMQGLLICILLYKGYSLISNQLMSLFLLIQALAGLYHIFSSNFNLSYNEYSHIGYFIIPFFLIWGPTMYLYIKTETTVQFQFKVQYLLHYIPFILITIYFLFSFHIHSMEEKTRLILSNELFTGPKRSNYFNFLALQVFVYNICSIFSIERFAKLNTLKNGDIQSRIKWNRFIIYGYFITCIFNNIARYIFTGSESQKISLYAYISAILFFIYFFILFLKALLGSHFGEKVKSSKILPLTDNQYDILSQRLESFMKEKKPFLEFNLSLAELASNLRLKERFLSQFINTYRHMSFQDYVNSYRIKEAKKLIEESNGTGKTILEIAYESGFNSKSAFNHSFKKHTHTTPTAYKKSLS